MSTFLCVLFESKEDIENLILFVSLAESVFIAHSHICVYKRWHSLTALCRWILHFSIFSQRKELFLFLIRFQLTKYPLDLFSSSPILWQSATYLIYKQILFVILLRSDPFSFRCSRSSSPFLSTSLTYAVHCAKTNTLAPSSLSVDFG